MNFNLSFWKQSYCTSLLATKHCTLERKTPFFLSNLSVLYKMLTNRFSLYIMSALKATLPKKTGYYSDETLHPVFFQPRQTNFNIVHKLFLKQILQVHF